VAYDWFRQAFTEFLLLVNSLHHVQVPFAISVSIFAYILVVCIAVNDLPLC